MSNRVYLSVGALALAGVVSCPALGDVAGQAPFNQRVCCTPRAALPQEMQGRAGEGGPGLTPSQLIERVAFSMLAPEQQAKLVSAGAVAPSKADALPPEIASLAPLGDEGYSVVRRIVSREVFDRMMPVHQRALVRIMEDQADGLPVAKLCFGPGSDPDVVEAFNRAAFGPFNARFQQGNRWFTTATNTVTTGQGDRITLRYSFVPDGTSVPNLNAAADTSGATSNLFAFMNGIYGSPAVWQPLYQQIFDRWSSLIGVTYVLEPNDDGVPIATGNSGAIGVRGDLRMSGTTLDGPSNVLAFNYFPSSGVGGDMVIDTADTFFNTITSNSLRLRNVLAHEHGHGLGMAHVCPINQTKLMEPTVSVAYDGPQFDDIMNGQRHYGDPTEPNDAIGTAVTISTLDATVRQVPQLLSIDDAADVDVFRFEVTAPGTLTVTASPQGSTYLDGPQNSNGSCSAGVNVDYLRINTLTVTGLSSTGATLLSAPASAAGVAATLNLQCPTPGTYYARVSGGQVANIQAYRLSYSYSTGPGLSVTATPPTLVSPTAPTTFNVQATVINDTLAPGTAKLFYRANPGLFQSVDLVPVSGTPGAFTATLPPFACASSPGFYVSIGSASGLTATFPTTGAAIPRTATVGASVSVFADDFEADRSWTYGVSGDTATTGQWIRAVPVGTAAQPGTTTSGTQCAVTGNATAGAAIGTNDVDTGFTTLLSPRFDLSNTISARVTYQRWYTNNQGQSPNTKIFAVDISSDDGATWTRAETVGPASPAAAWIASGFDVPATVARTANMRVRFVADDTGTGSLVEAAVDDFAVTAIRCTNPTPPCPADFDQSGQRTIDDIFIFLAAWFANDPRADFDGLNGRTIDDIFLFLNAWFAGCP